MKFFMRKRSIATSKRKQEKEGEMETERELARVEKLAIKVNIE